MQPCMNWCCACAVVCMNVWIRESINAWMYECIDVWLYNLYDGIYIVCDRWTRRDKTGKIGSGLTSQYKHSTNFLGDGIVVNKSSHWQCKTLYKVETDASPGESPLLIKSLEEVAICKLAQSVLSSTCFSNHVFLFFFLLKIHNFCLDRHFGFSVH